MSSLSTSSLLQHPLFSFTAFIMISIHLDPRRLSRASLQNFYVIKTHLKHIVIVLGSTGNAYLISIKPSTILCNCPDKVRSCKHVIFIVSACGFIDRRHRLSYVNIPFRSLLHQLHATPSPPILDNALLDNHTSKLCSIHTYSPCFFCALQPATQPPQTLIICSRCGFLCHTNCLHQYMDDHNNRSKYQNNCPRCGRTSVRLKSPFLSGYRNFSSILQHRGYQCQNVQQSITTQPRAVTSSTNSFSRNRGFFNDSHGALDPTPIFHANCSESSIRIKDV